MPILVDTGALELLRRRNTKVEDLAIRFYPPILCAHVAAEFLYGQVLAKVSPTAFVQAQEFLDSFEFLAPDRSTATRYARIRARLKALGQSMPDPDYWIAAHAIEEQVPLVTTDTDFRLLTELELHVITRP
ncbi:MAG TPA: type II toxin-antitoxin system VapC family toxin [Candidatus Udaeobacter sp.]|nr:type II toxin-antitoxin system VapC family toxin [Candidatus Udaeobacter sp.]